MSYLRNIFQFLVITLLPLIVSLNGQTTTTSTTLVETKDTQSKLREKTQLIRQNLEELKNKLRISKHTKLSSEERRKLQIQEAMKKLWRGSRIWMNTAHHIESQKTPENKLKVIKPIELKSKPASVSVSKQTQIVSVTSSKRITSLPKIVGSGYTQKQEIQTIDNIFRDIINVIKERTDEIEKVKEEDKETIKTMHRKEDLLYQLPLLLDAFIKEKNKICPDRKLSIRSLTSSGTVMKEKRLCSNKYSFCDLFCHLQTEISGKIEALKAASYRWWENPGDELLNSFEDLRNRVLRVINLAKPYIQKESVAMKKVSQLVNVLDHIASRHNPYDKLSETERKRIYEIIASEVLKYAKDLRFNTVTDAEKEQIKAWLVALGALDKNSSIAIELIEPGDVRKLKSYLDTLPTYIIHMGSRRTIRQTEFVDKEKTIKFIKEFLYNELQPLLGGTGGGGKYNNDFKKVYDQFNEFDLSRAIEPEKSELANFEGCKEAVKNDENFNNFLVSLGVKVDTELDKIEFSPEITYYYSKREKIEEFKQIYLKTEELINGKIDNKINLKGLLELFYNYGDGLRKFFGGKIGEALPDCVAIRQGRKEGSEIRTDQQIMRESIPELCALLPSDIEYCKCVDSYMRSQTRLLCPISDSEEQFISFSKKLSEYCGSEHNSFNLEERIRQHMLEDPDYKFFVSSLDKCVQRMLIVMEAMKKLIDLASDFIASSKWQIYKQIFMKQIELTKEISNFITDQSTLQWFEKFKNISPIYYLGITTTNGYCYSDRSSNVIYVSNIPVKITNLGVRYSDVYNYLPHSGLGFLKENDYIYSLYQNYFLKCKCNLERTIILPLTNNAKDLLYTKFVEPLLVNEEKAGAEKIKEELSNFIQEDKTFGDLSLIEQVDKLNKYVHSKWYKPQKFQSLNDRINFFLYLFKNSQIVSELGKAIDNLKDSDYTGLIRRAQELGGIDITTLTRDLDNLKKNIDFAKDKWFSGNNEETKVYLDFYNFASKTFAKQKSQLKCLQAVKDKIESQIPVLFTSISASKSVIDECLKDVYKEQKSDFETFIRSNRDIIKFFKLITLLNYHYSRKDVKKNELNSKALQEELETLEPILKTITESK